MVAILYVGCVTTEEPGRPVSSAKNAGKANCPCINPGLLARQAPLFGSQLNSSNVLAAHNGVIYRYPANYGVGFCDKWDQGRPPFCNARDMLGQDGNKKCCESKWCFVDATCQLEKLPSPFFESGVFLSYETCEETPEEGDELANRQLPTRFNSMSGKTLRVGFPAGDDYPYTFDSSNGIMHAGDDRRVAGASVELLADILHHAGANGTAAAILPLSRKLYPGSGYSACCHSVALGALDVCAGNYWQSLQRLQLTTFGPMVFPDYFVFAALQDAELKSGAAYFFDQAGKVFKPFTWKLWLLIVSVVALMGLWIHINEYGRTGIHLLDSMYLSLLWFVAQEAKYDPDARSGGRIIAVALGIFSVVTSATYTANLASFLMAQSVNTLTWNTLDDAVGQNVKICTADSVIKTVVMHHPSLGPWLVACDDEECLTRYLQDGTCKMLIVWVAMANRLKSGSGAVPCGYIFSLTPFLQTAVAFPVASQYQLDFGFIQAEVLAEKNWEAYVAPFPLTNNCSTVDDVAGGSQQLDIVQMLGLWMTMIGLFLYWVMYKIFHVCILRKSVRDYDLSVVKVSSQMAATVSRKRAMLRKANGALQPEPEPELAHASMAMLMNLQAWAKRRKHGGGDKSPAEVSDTVTGDGHTHRERRGRLRQRDLLREVLGTVQCFVENHVLDSSSGSSDGDTTSDDIPEAGLDSGGRVRHRASSGYVKGDSQGDGNLEREGDNDGNQNPDTKLGKQSRRPLDHRVHQKHRAPGARGRPQGLQSPHLRSAADTRESNSDSKEAARTVNGVSDPASELFNAPGVVSTMSSAAPPSYTPVTITTRTSITHPIPGVLVSSWYRRSSS